MQHIAIYDLDRTILKKPTFTAFLIFAARAKADALWWRTPIWIAALIGYKLKLYGRKPMKQFGMKLFVGKNISATEAKNLATRFAASIVPSDVSPGAAAAIADDRVDQSLLVMATAAPDIYADEIARLLDFDAVIATRQQRLPDGGFGHLIDGENCYAAEKLRRVQEWLASEGLGRKQCYIRFYTDHPSDAPLLDWVDEAILVGEGAAMATLARKHGWQLKTFKSSGNG